MGRKYMGMIKQLWKEKVMLAGEKEGSISICIGGLREKKLIEIAMLTEIKYSIENIYMAYFIAC